MRDGSYIHGTDSAEQTRLAALNRLTNQAFLAFVGVSHADRVLEVGCGIGHLAEQVAAGGAWTVGVEYSAEQLALAVRGDASCHFVRGDAHRLPFADNSFDIVYCRYVLEHLSDPIAALIEMRRVAAPGGRVIAQENDNAIQRLDPDCPAFEELWDRFNLLQIGLGGDPYIGKRLYRLFRTASFHAIELSIAPEVYHAGQPGFQVWVDNLAAIVDGAAERLLAEGLADADQIRLAVQELAAFRNGDNATALFHWNRAVGVK